MHTLSRLSAAVLTTACLTLTACGSTSTEMDVPSTPASAAETGELTDFVAGANDPAVGVTAPALTGNALFGSGTVTAASGSSYVAVFAAHWCPHCNAELPVLAEYLDGNDPAANIYLVSSDTREGVQNFPPDQWLQDKMGWPIETAPVIDDADNALAGAFGLSGFPFFVAVNADGDVVARASGELGAEQFDALVKSASN